MHLTSYHLPENQALSEAYLRNFAAVSERFDYDYQQSACWRERADSLDRSAQPRASRSGVIQALVSFNRRMGNAPQALANIEKLADDRALVVSGGQQAGLFTGQLLVIYKAITLLQAAREASEQLRRPVIPVFWIAGEDHDFDEVNHIYTLTPGMEIERIRLEARHNVRTSVSRRKIAPEEWEAVLTQLEAGLMDTEFKPGLMAKLREITACSATLVECFGRLMAWLFGEQGLVLLDSDDPELRAQEGPMFRLLIEENGRLNQSLIEGRKAVERLGFEPQSEIKEGQANLFVFAGEERLLLHRTPEGFTDKREAHFFTAQQLLELADREPQRLSNNVMTRPLMQEFLFPVLGTVLGPGEIAYWALTREAFHHFGMKVPIVIPRMEVTLIEGTLQKHMNKFELSLDDIRLRFDEKKEEWLSAQDTLQLKERFAEVKTGFADRYRPLLEVVASINPGLKKLGETNLLKILEQIDFLEARSTDAFQSKFEAAIRQMDRVRLSLFPMGRPQERVYNIFAYLNKYGDSWLKELAGAPLNRDGYHKLCYF